MLPSLKIPLSSDSTELRPRIKELLGRIAKIGCRLLLLPAWGLGARVSFICTSGQ
jgi:hypothetical protein